MSRPTNAWRKVMAQPGHFTLRVLKAFQKNQGLLLSGALAYYILLSVICSRMAAESTGNDEANVTAQGSQQRRFVDHVREHEEAET